MILDKAAVAGLIKIYGAQGKTIWVYKDDTNDIQVLAKPHADDPPRDHPLHPNYHLAGFLDMTTGRMAVDKEPAVSDRNWKSLLYTLLKVIIAIGLAAAAVLVVILAVASGRSGTLRPRH